MKKALPISINIMGHLKTRYPNLQAANRSELIVSFPSGEYRSKSCRHVRFFFSAFASTNSNIMYLRSCSQPTQKDYAISISFSAICTALSAAPFLRLSATIHILMPFSIDSSWRILPT